MKRTFLHIILFSFLLIQIGQSQEYITTQFYKEDGLPSDYCYNAIQDPEGFLWIATEAGVVSFDGQNFQPCSYPELENKEIIQIFKDSWDRIWMVELSGEVFYIKNGKLEQLDYPFIEASYRIVSIADDQNGYIWLNDLHNPLACGFDVETLELKYSYNSYEQQLNLLQSPGYLFESTKIALTGQGIFLSIEGQELTFKNFNINKFYAKRVVMKNGNQIFEYDDELFEYDVVSKNIRPFLKKFQPYFNQGIQNLTKDNHESLWIASQSGFYKISSPDSSKSSIEGYFKGANSGFVTLDNQDNIWLTTTDQGLIKLHETNIEKIIDEKSNNITRMVHLLDHLVYGTSKGEVVVLNNENIEILRHNIEKKSASIYGLEIIDENRVLITSNKELNILNLNTMAFTTIQELGFYKSASISPNKKIIWTNGGQNNYISSIDGGNFTGIAPNIRSYCSLPISDEAAYIGTVNGLFKSHINGSAEQILPSTIQVDVRSISKDYSGNIWIGTHGSGVYIMQSDTLLYHLDNLPSNHIRDIVQDKEKMWVATNNGLCLVKKINQNYNIKVLDKGDGLSSEQINSLFIHEDQIYAATTKGISVIDRNIEFDKEVPIIKINSVKINERDTSVLSNYHLDSDQRNIKFDFSGILFNKPRSIQFKYMLSGLDSDWIFTDKSIAQYPLLPPGEYTFLLKAKSLNSRWSDLKKVDFIIPKKISEMLIFNILLALMSFLLLLLIFMFFSRTIEQSRNFKISQMTALRTQMNPHFIFNSLNSVQDYILRDDKIAANKYISNFSKMMRYILNASEKEFTNLKQELDALEVYMSIESMRFDNEINYNIELSENLEPEKYLIPTMLLQPFIENAINHGLKHAEGDKKLVLRVRKYKSGIVVEIEDNGVGRIKSNKIKMLSNNNYDSKATKINQKRIELLNKYHQKENKVTFKDIYDSDNKATGTKVEIFLQSIKFS